MDAQQLRGHHRRHRVGDVCHDVHPPAGRDGVDEAVDNLLNALPQMLNTTGGERDRRNATNAAVGRWVQEEHLANHHAGDRGELPQTELGELLRSGRAAGQELLENLDNVGVAGHDPGVQVRIPVHRRRLAELGVERIRVSQHGWVEQAEQAQRRIRLAHRQVTSGPGKRVGKALRILVGEHRQLCHHRLLDLSRDAGHGWILEHLA